MSLCEQDLIQVTLDESLLRAGAISASRSFHHQLPWKKRIGIHDLYQLAAIAQAHLALRRWLDGLAVGYHLLPSSPVTEHSPYDLVLGGRRVKSVPGQLPSRSSPMEPSSLPRVLQASVAFAWQPASPEPLLDTDILVFVFLLGAQPRAQDRRDEYLIAIPRHRLFSDSRRWRPLGKTTLENHGQVDVELEIGGLTLSHRLGIERCLLPSRGEKVLDEHFCALLYLHAASAPGGSLRVRFSESEDTWFIHPFQWKNLILALESIILAGWLTVAELHAKAGITYHPLAAGGQRPGSLTIPVCHLRPMSNLIERLGQG